MLFALSAKAARPVKYNYTADTSSYNMYLTGQWHSIIKLAKHDKAINFYYYNLRVAIAYMNLGDFSKATQWFRRAEELSAHQVETAGYHYRSAIASGELFDAQRLAARFPQFGFNKAKPLTYLAIDAGFSTNSDYNNNLKRSIIASGTDESQQLLTKNMDFKNFYAGQRLSPTISFNEAFGTLNLNKTQCYTYSTGGDTNISVNTTQWQAYFNTQISLNDRFSFTPAISVLGLKIGSIQKTSNTKTIIDSTYVVQPPKKPYWQIKSRNVTTNSYNSFENTATQYIASVRADYRLPHTNMWICGSKSNFNTQKQTQYGAGIRQYIGSKIYIEGALVHLKNNKNQFVNESNAWIYNASTGFRLNRVSADLSFTTGDMRNYASNNGLVLYNSLDMAKQMIGGNIKYHIIQNKLLFSAFYNSSVMEGYDYNYMNAVYNNKNTFNYTMHTIAGGITWIF